MKKIECFLRPEKTGEVVEALKLAGASGVTVIEVSGFGVERVPDATLHPKVKLEVLATDGQLRELLDVIQVEARSGRIGDGKIVVTAVEEVIRVRTGEHGAAALS